MRAGLILLAIMLCPQAFAADEAASPKQKHFHVDAPADHCAAIAMLADAYTATYEAHQKGDMEAIHKASYHLETANAYLQQELKALAETVEHIHLASEKKQTKPIDEKIELFYQQADEVMAHCH